MSALRKTGLALCCSTFLIAPAAQAQTDEIESLRAQIAALETQLEQLSTRLDNQEARTTPVNAASDQTEISFGGAPEIEADGGWSFKPFGRIQADAGFTSLPDGLNRDDGVGSELRRARLGLQGDIPGGFGYKMEVDFAGNSAELTDAIITYDDDGLTLTAGQHNPFQSLEELTSSRFSSFIERAAFTDAFGFERRLGVSAQYSTDSVLVQAGVFSDNIDDLSNKNWSLDGRAIFAPEMGEVQLHLGGSVHWTDLEGGSSVRYRQRPLVHFTSERLIDTGNMAAESEFGAGLEAAAIAGPFHFAGEAFWQEANGTAGMSDRHFFGGYLEAGYFLTGGDSRGYKGFKFDRTRPSSPIDEGGIGAVQVNLRYDYLDLSDNSIAGGYQNAYLASLVWVPTDYTRLMFNYARLEYDDAVAALPAGSTSYSADVFGVRAQVDF